MSLYPSTGRKFWTTPGMDRSGLLRAQKNAYKTGSALANHAKAVHDGQASSDCPACREIQAKMQKVA